jgi:hypothetical protein
MSQARLYVDEDASENAVIFGLRARGIDVVSASEAGLRAASDARQLEFAISTGRVLYTFNACDFARLHGEILAQGRSHPGIIVIPNQRYSIGEKIRRISNFLQSRPAATLVSQIFFL